MNLRTYTKIWLFLLTILSIEYFFLNFRPQFSLLAKMGHIVRPEPGRPLSLILGWAGMGIMATMNIYMLRKRLRFMSQWGQLRSWLDFHILCGLVGPTFILFHSNFKVRGLVAISFWSMIISASSGIVGRYFYIQLLARKKDLDDDVLHFSNQLEVLRKNSTPQLTVDAMERLKRKALDYVGVGRQMFAPDGTMIAGVLGVFISSLRGDIRLKFSPPNTAMGLGPESRDVLKCFALAQRKSLFLSPFQKLLGYWHTFHTPFAIFMYVAAVIHIATALLFGVAR